MSVTWSEHQLHAALLQWRFSSWVKDFLYSIYGKYLLTERWVGLTVVRLWQSHECLHQSGTHPTGPPTHAPHPSRKRSCLTNHTAPHGASYTFCWVLVQSPLVAQATFRFTTRQQFILKRQFFSGDVGDFHSLPLSSPGAPPQSCGTLLACFPSAAAMTTCWNPWRYSDTGFVIWYVWVFFFFWKHISLIWLTWALGDSEHIVPTTQLAF